ncbi:MAG: DF family (seleno)protein [Terriglobales bacterium]
MMPLQVELLLVEGCPHAAAALARLREVLRQEGLGADVRQVLVRDGAQARALRFFGSPTIRVNGHDVGAAPDSAAYGLACRLPEGGLPTAAAIRAALRGAG